MIVLFHEIQSHITYILKLNTRIGRAKRLSTMYKCVNLKYDSFFFYGDSIKNFFANDCLELPPYIMYYPIKGDSCIYNTCYHTSLKSQKDILLSKILLSLPYFPSILRHSIFLRLIWLHEVHILYPNLHQNYTFSNNSSIDCVYYLRCEQGKKSFD